LQQDGLGSAEVDVGRCEVLQAFMITPVNRRGIRTPVSG
jgi:hypothetical protein